MKNKEIAAFILCLVLACVQSPAAAGEFAVSPITMELGPGVKSGAFTVTNTGGDKISFQVSASEWTQDAEGKDLYAETRDLVFFPKILTVEKGEQRVIRVGFRFPAGAAEKTYRLFIEEMPSPQNRGAGGARVSFVIRFAPPVFVAPAERKTAGAIDAIRLHGGKISAVVRNRGNVHFRVNSFLLRGRSADGAEIFSREIDGGYVLQGAARKIEVPFPQENCANLSVIEIEAKAANLNLNGKLDVQQGMCNP
jgi:fimbrial chaperone protein